MTSSFCLYIKRTGAFGIVAHFWFSDKAHTGQIPYIKTDLNYIAAFLLFQVFYSIFAVFYIKLTIGVYCAE
jgi:hypothetical protein